LPPLTLPSKLRPVDTLYNRVASQNLERLAALSDGVFAVAMTLLVLDLHAPARELIHSQSSLLHALIPLTPRFIMYLMSFLTLGIFWSGQQTQLNHFAATDRNLTWIHLAFLFTITLLPFSTLLLGEFITYRIALLFYWFNIFLTGITLIASWRYATHSLLLKPDVSPEVRRALLNRVLIAQSLYAAGAVLCFINTYVSIAFIVLVQLNYAIAPLSCLAARRNRKS
jgi:uncharacterized membrane protein